MAPERQPSPIATAAPSKTTTDIRSATLHRFALPELGRDIAGILAGGGPLERRLDHEEDHAHYLVRLAPYRSGDQYVGGVVISFMDVTGLTQAERHQRVLIAELQHRTRNLLNVVQAIVMQTLGRNCTPRTLKDRLAALGRVQSLVSQSKGDEVDLAEVVRLELRAYAGEADGRVTVTGPPLALGYERVQILALALHELTTNAVKHGALEGEGRRLEIRWEVVSGAGAPLLVLDWRESGVVRVAQSDIDLTAQFHYAAGR